MEQQVQHLASGVAVIKETLFGTVSSPSRPVSPAPGPRHAYPTPHAETPGALLASHGVLTCSSFWQPWGHNWMHI